MEINFSNLVNAALPDRHKHGSHNAVILSNNMGPNHNEQGFLSKDFPRSPHKLYITAEGDEFEFDQATLAAWREEGFEVRYLALGDGESDAHFKRRLSMLGETSGLGPCETYGIVAFGDAAGICLEHFHVMENNPEFKLSCLVAYYPTRIPDTRAQFPSAIEVLVHLADENSGSGGKDRKKEDGIEVDVVSHSQLVGIQGKRRVTRRKVDRGIGVGARAKFAYPCYTYDVPPGFAEQDLDEYDRVAAELAWTRSLTAVRRGFRMNVDIEIAVEQHVEGKFYARNLNQTMSAFSTTRQPHVTYLPTLTGGIGAEELQQFYADYFLATNPPSTKLTLLSRTIGVDRVVDELHLAFKHTQETPWILPGVPPTNKRVEIVLVSIVTLRGGKLCHEHVYWDQASVLMQVGLLDPHLVPGKFKESTSGDVDGSRVKKLPVVGRTAARRLLHGFDGEDGEADNELMPGWYDDDDDEDEEVNAANGGKNGIGGPYRDGDNAKAKDKGEGKAKGIEQPPPNNLDAPKKQKQEQKENEETNKPTISTPKGNAESKDTKIDKVDDEDEEKNEPNNETTTNGDDDKSANLSQTGEDTEKQEGDAGENGVTDGNESGSPAQSIDRDGEDGEDE